MKCLFYAQHFRGIGHLVRSLALAQEMANRGHNVVFINGGRWPNNLEKPLNIAFIQLPALASDRCFETLIDENDQPVSGAWLENRTALLCQSAIHFSADITVIESWPFARYKMTPELLAFVNTLKKHHPNCSTWCSVRDILEAKGDKRANKMLAYFNRYFDGLLVHGDPALIPIEASFPALTAVKEKTHYTGYVDASENTIHCADSAKPPELDKAEIVVSVGNGGLDGGDLLLCALAAARLNPQWSWLLLIGDAVPESIKDALKQAPDHVKVESNRSDFRSILSQAKASVSRLGYNTCIDLLTTHCPAVVIPVTEQGQLEQKTRAKLLSQHSNIRVLTEKAQAEELSLAIHHVVNAEASSAEFDIALKGAQASAIILERQYAKMNRH